MKTMGGPDQGKTFRLLDEAVAYEMELTMQRRQNWAHLNHNAKSKAKLSKRQRLQSAREARGAGEADDLAIETTLIEQVLQAELCPKARKENIPEYAALLDLMKKGHAAAWDLKVLLQTWVVLQGIRGEKGLEACQEILIRGDHPQWESDTYCKNFHDQWMAKYAQAVRSTKRVSALSHEEGLHAGMSGHNFVSTLQCPTQRACMWAFACKMMPFFVKGFSAETVLGVKKLVRDSGILLRLPTPSKRGAGMRSCSGYNSMHWSRSFAMLVGDILQSPPIRFTPELWEEYTKS